MVSLSHPAAARKRRARPFAAGLFPAAPPVAVDPSVSRIRLARAIAEFRHSQHGVVLTPDQALAAVDALLASEIRTPACEIPEGGAR